MSYKIPEVTFLYNWTTSTDITPIASNIISIIFESNLSNISDTLEIIVTGIDSLVGVNEQDLIEINFKYRHLAEEVRSGIFKVDYISRTYGPRQTMYSALQFDWGVVTRDVFPVTYDAPFNSVARITDILAAIQNYYMQRGYALQNFMYPNTPANLINFARRLRDSIRPGAFDENEVSKPNARPYVIRADSRVEMLKNIADMFGFVFNIRTILLPNNQVSGALVFLHYKWEVESRRQIGTLSPLSIRPGIEFRQSLSTTLGACSSGFHRTPGNVPNPPTFSNLSTAWSRVYDDGTATLRQSVPPEIYVNVDTAQQRAFGEIIKVNVPKFACTLECEGGTGLIAGNSIVLSGFNSKFDGKYCIHKARHTLNSGGWVTRLEMCRSDTIIPRDDPRNPWATHPLDPRTPF